MKRLHAKGKESEVATERVALCFGYEYSLQGAKPAFNRARQAQKKRPSI